MQSHSTPYRHTLSELAGIAARNEGTEVAFVDTWTEETCTWNTFHERSNRAANAFREHAAQGDRIAFLCEGSTEHVTLWMGALKAGCVVSNLHTKASAETLQHCVDELSPQVVVIDEGFSELYSDAVHGEVAASIGRVVVIGEAARSHEQSAESFLDDRADTPPAISVDQDDLAAVIWTSGTTGFPKGWCFTHRGLMDRGMKLLSLGGNSQGSRRLQGLTPSFAAWYSGIIPSLLSRPRTYFVQEWDPEKYLRLVDEEGLTGLGMVPTMWHELLSIEDFEDYDLSSLESIAAVGEKLTVDTLHNLRENVCENVVNSYSATESVVTHIMHDGEHEDVVGTVGKPVPMTDVRIVDPDGTPEDELPDGEVGEILVRTNDQPVWAWNDTAKLEDAFVDGWWRSGDMGYRDEDGFLYLEGRKDFIIKTKGIKVSPSPIEERLDDHPKVEKAAVVGVEDEEFGQKVTAVINAADGSVTAEELDDWCLESDTVARVERPRAYEIVEEELPRTVTGKLDRANTKEEFVA